MSNKKPTIKEIAKLAGVSTATVDRVLNGRGKVNERTRSIVLSAMKDAERADFRIVRQQGTRHVGAMIHEGPNPFLDSFVDELIKKFEETHQNIQLTIVRAPIDNPKKQAKLIDELAQDCDCLALMPIDHPLFAKAVSDALAKGLPVLSLLSPMPSLDGISSIGQNNRAAGRTAGQMAALFTPQRQGRFVVLVGKCWFPSHESRQQGFRLAFHSLRPNVTLDGPFETHDDHSRLENYLIEVLNDPDLVGIYNAGGCNTTLVNVLRKHSEKNLTVVCHDRNEATEMGILEGILSAIVHQDATRSATMATESILSAMERSKSTPSYNYAPIEIFTTENLI